MEYPKEFLSHAEASEFLNISENYLYTKVSKGEICRYKLPHSKKNLYKISDLESVLTPIMIKK